MSKTQKYEVKFADNDVHIIDVVEKEGQKVKDSEELKMLKSFRDASDRTPVVVESKKTNSEMLYS